MMHPQIKPIIVCLLAIILTSFLVVEAERWFGADLEAFRIGVTSAIIGIYCYRFLGAAKPPK